MRKLSKIFVLMMCAIVSIGLFGACGPASGDGNTYRVTFNLSYSAPADARIAMAQVESGQTVAKPTEPARAGYTFDGWFTDALFANEYDFSLPVTSDLVLRAHWVQTDAHVTYYLYGGSAQTGTVRVGEALSEPTKPSRDGYLFGGWYSDPLLTREYDFTRAVTGNIQLYAKWQQTEATVTFDYGYGERVETANVEIGQFVEEPTEPTREDYEFIGWYTNAQTTGVPYDFSGIVKGDMILYGGWKLVNATITYNCNYDGAPEPSAAKVKVGNTMQAPAEPDRTGHTFAGWCLDDKGKRPFDFSSAITGNMTLFANWTVNKYTVTFDWNVTGSTPYVEESVEYDTVVNMPEIDPPANAGKVFVGWCTDAECEIPYNFDSHVTGDMTLYARWNIAATDEIVITFYTADGTSDAYRTYTAKQGTRLTEPEQPTRKGYYFAGWAIDSPAGTLWNFRRDFVQSSTNLYAKWLKGYNFEAEYTDLENKAYHGWSSDGIGGTAQLVATDINFSNAADMKISNGALVWCLLYNGAFLEFNIHSDVAVNDAVLVLRMTPDGYDYELDDTEWRIKVNEKYLDYGHLCMPQGDKYSELQKRPLENYVMTISLALKKGDNVIRLETNNMYDHTGTYNAETPLIDCVTVYSSSTLAWSEGKCYPDNVGQSMADVDYAIDFEGDFDTNRDHANCPLGNNK